MKKISHLHSLAVVFLCALAGCGEQAAASKPGTATPASQAKNVSPEESLAQLQKSAEAGNAEAQFKLGWIYVRGEGFTGMAYVRDIPKDLAKAHAWYQKAAAQGHANAQYNLGMLFKLGLGVEENPQNAFLWLQKAAAQGNDLAQYNLGLLYAAGAGVKRDLTRASAWLALAAAQGNEKANKSYLETGEKLTQEQRAESQFLVASWKKGAAL